MNHILLLLVNQRNLHYCYPYQTTKQRSKNRVKNNDTVLFGKARFVFLTI